MTRSAAPPRGAMLAICAALQWEVRPVIRGLTEVRRTTIDSVPVWQGRCGDQPVLVFRTGIGLEPAAASARVILDRFPLIALINTGCAGGLAPHLAAGSLVIPELLMAGTEAAPISYRTDVTWTDALRTAAHAAQLPVDRTPLFTTPTPLGSAAAKRAAHDRFQAAAVEMEGSAVAGLAAGRNIPFAAARVILDDAATDLPPVTGFVAPDGSLRPFAAAIRIIRQPSHLPALLQLSSSARRAEQILERLFRGFLRQREDSSNRV